MCNVIPMLNPFVQANHFYKDTHGDWILLTLDPAKLTSKV